MLLKLPERKCLEFGNTIPFVNWKSDREEPTDLSLHIQGLISGKVRASSNPIRDYHLHRIIQFLEGLSIIMLQYDFDPNHFGLINDNFQLINLVMPRNNEVRHYNRDPACKRIGTKMNKDSIPTVLCNSENIEEKGEKQLISLGGIPDTFKMNPMEGNNDGSLCSSSTVTSLKLDCASIAKSLLENPPPHLGINSETRGENSNNKTTTTNRRNRRKVKIVIPYVNNETKTYEKKSILINKIYSCTDCGKSFKTRSGLQMHERLHTGEKPYSCKFCDKFFTTWSHLKYHHRIHTGEKTYTCKDCGQSFLQSTDLILHRKIHRGQKSFSCEECGKSFTQSSGLIQHRRIHTGERPYSCEECGKSFTQATGLTQHHRIHTGERPYSCRGCEKTFTQLSGLIQHQATHTTE